MWAKGTHQESCVDCGFHHASRDCPFRSGRIRRLKQEIAEKQHELDGLAAFDAQARGVEGW